MKKKFVRVAVKDDVAIEVYSRQLELAYIAIAISVVVYSGEVNKLP